MAKRITRILVAALLIQLMAFGSLQAEVPVRIQRIWEALPCKPAPADTVFRCPELSPKASIAVAYAPNGELQHLGLCVFTADMKRMSNPILCNCFERILLELLVIPTHGERMKMLKEEKIRLNLNGYALGSESFPDYRKALSMFTSEVCTSIDEQPEGYAFRLEDKANDETLYMFVPKDRELIFGTDKKEEDDLMSIRLFMGSTERLHPVIPDPATMHKTDRENLYLRGGEAYMIDSLRNDIYYRRNAIGDYEILFDSIHPVESFTNFLLGQVAQPDFRLDLTHRRYGLTPPRFDIDWASMFATLCPNDVRCYAGARLMEGGKEVSGVLVIHHPKFGYIDMVTITAPVSELFSQQPRLRAYLFTHVPQNNIYNLFE